MERLVSQNVENVNRTLPNNIGLLYFLLMCNYLKIKLDILVYAILMIIIF